ncbi:MAG: macro domain-containing protein [Pseudodesulfovibrio sp.]|uniref:Appr-1-p processing domain protein n=1 Tax=Pseudodesulfovibrio aespoeensis (strain ATCC 700646 / DSM 10631 / Aspo-2) TaxID=643562 RepID=E6VRF7_PSEA9|nr:MULTISPECIES: macro domain-containing protein [Pseudodesulfovibrio]MBU4244638.1 macro domain-containing protein [Pseudomonadota bacterium]ADU61886.1 Appr-1-p processing domain protein [Pseudodesulfovibrio aespoeensis Aspo-2]MBU4380106.1 macro domain-containing protein [Pseudomonadota bacterium]MBU4476373.1 macro domain-containing protein [Pseudomonadota bacterium]MBU4514865.1 macro domain-containing protein [Pseudomonadota bacterium]
MRHWKIGPGQLVIRQGDITTLDVDCVVNAANPQLAGGGGVDGAIHRAAGIAQLRQACQAIIDDPGQLPTGQLPVGQAVLTLGFDLPARYIIHTVGPIWRGGVHGESEQLRSSYQSSLKLAHQHALATIAFPALSCGAYGYPIPQAARIALDAIRQGLLDGLAAQVHMVLHDHAACETWLATASDIL